MKILLFILLSAPLLNALAGVYSWKDDNGVVHFSDASVEGAKEVKVKELPTVRINRPQVKKSSQKSGGTSEKKRYSALTIQSPQAEEAIRSNNGKVNVSWSLVPGLLSGNYQYVVLDGKEYATSGASKSFDNLDRGGHTVSIVVKDNNGAKVTNSEPVTFYVLRAFK